MIPPPPREFKTSIPADDGGAGDKSFDFALEVANVFDDIVTYINQHVLTDKTLITTYQNHVLNNANYSTYWEYALSNNEDLKNSLIILLPLDALLLQATVFSITCIMARKKLKI